MEWLPVLPVKPIRAPPNRRCGDRKPNLPILPAAPTIVTFPAAGTTTINSTRTITPGSYGECLSEREQDLTLAGPGVYVFSSIRNKRLFNTFKFDFRIPLQATF